MKTLQLYVAAVVFLCGMATADATTIYLVRHAEKQTSDPQDRDPALTEAGIARATTAGKILRHIEFTTIYSSDYQRTRDTAKLIKGERAQAIELYDPRDLDAFAKQLKAASADSVFLVVGHSNTTPQLTQLLSDQAIAPIDESVYHHLYRVGIAEDGSSTVDLLSVPPISESVLD